ncbi:MAG: winged helix-turn-helix transcriptional regulator [Rhizobiales bacterium]|nr:winged helix-turn-helix transcriptional regulator [Hyphomicrobiales bacterium]
MTKTPNETTMRAWARLMKSQHLLLSRVETALKVADLPPLTWYDVLLELERAGADGLRPFELEQHLLLAQYNLSRLLDRIEKAGFIRRKAHKEDGRGQLVSITRAGSAVRRKMWPVYGSAMNEIFGDQLSGKQMAELANLLGDLIDHASAK